jgi:hypothetical protein
MITAIALEARMNRRVAHRVYGVTLVGLDEGVEPVYASAFLYFPERTASLRALRAMYDHRGQLADLWLAYYRAERGTVERERARMSLLAFLLDLGVPLCAERSDTPGYTPSCGLLVVGG